MHLGKVIGTIWATRKYPALEGAKLQIVQPVDKNLDDRGAPLVAVDTIGAGSGEIVMYITSREATIPYRVELVPIDASIIGIVDRVDVQG
ncbi:MAG TPA: ethanolamine utilization protein EutN [Bacteroidetes bacterium]|nr:ethanolamine utilization protein EutN [Bacteroidota bacterium]